MAWMSGDLPSGVIPPSSSFRRLAYHDGKFSQTIVATLIDNYFLAIVLNNTLYIDGGYLSWEFSNGTAFSSSMAPRGAQGCQSEVYSLGQTTTLFQST